MSTTAPPAVTYRAGELVVIIAGEASYIGKTATVLLSNAGGTVVKVLDGPRLLCTADQLMDAAEFWAREHAHH